MLRRGGSRLAGREPPKASEKVAYEQRPEKAEEGVRGETAPAIKSTSESPDVVVHTFNSGAQEAEARPAWSTE